MLSTNDKVLHNLNAKVDGLASTFKNLVSFNKIIETQLAQLVAFVPALEIGKI